MRRWLTTVLCVSGLLLALTAVASPESERTVLKRAIRNFQKLKSYRVATSVEGGFAQGADHKITEYTVRQTYNAEVYGSVTHVSDPCEIYRTPSGGTVKHEDGRWLSILSTSEGQELQRLFVPLPKVLAEIYKYRRTAEWLEPEPDSLTARGGNEAEGTRSREGSEEEGPVSHRMRIVGPESTALDHFIRIQNSGCFSKG